MTRNGTASTPGRPTGPTGFGDGPAAAAAAGNGGGGGKSFVSSGILDQLGPGNAQSIPLPLLVLGGLAVLLAAGGARHVARPPDPGAPGRPRRPLAAPRR